MRFAGAALAVLLAASAHGARLSPRIVNGVQTAGHPAVGALLVGPSPGTAGLECTGTLIGCRTFVTAAHCVCAGDGVDCVPGGALAPDPARLFVFLQHAGVFGVESVSLRTDFVFPVGDVAVLRLAAPVTGVRPVPLNDLATPAAGTPGTIVGFGRQGNGLYDYGLKRVGAVSLEACTTGSPVTSVCWAFEAPVGAPGTDSNTCNGDSGGPLFVDLGTGPVLAGITSGGDAAQCAAPDHSFDANVFHYASWIAAQAGSDLGGAGCGDVATVGQPAVTVQAYAGTLDAVTADAAFSFDVPAGVEQLRVALNGDDAADFDLYVRRGAPATLAAYDCKDDAPSQFGACALAPVTSGTWHVLVHRYAGTGAFQVTATVFGDDGGCGPVPLGGACDDGSACTTGDVCTPSGCQGVAAADGTTCDDGVPCTTDACIGGTCVGAPAPRSDCLAPATTGGSTLVLHDASPDDHDALVWRWGKANASLADLGTPTAGGGYALCVYDGAGGTSRLVMAHSLGGGPGWKTTRTGYKFADRLGATGGITSLALKAGTRQNARITLKARGPALAMPSLPLGTDPAVTVQLLGAKACFEARYPVAVANDPERFQARTP